MGTKTYNDSYNIGQLCCYQYIKDEIIFIEIHLVWNDAVWVFSGERFLLLLLIISSGVRVKLSSRTIIIRLCQHKVFISFFVLKTNKTF